MLKHENVLMKKVLPSFIFGILLFISCNKENGELPNDSILKLDESIQVDGINRTFHIQYPHNHMDKPLVILLHGHKGSSDQVIGKGLVKSPQKIWLELAEAHEFIVLIPNGELGPRNSRGWNDCRSDAPANPTTDDVKFIMSLLNEIEQKYNHDLDRVYVAGISNGALMTHRLVEEIPESIAAFASIINTMPANSDCVESDVVVSALFMNGTMDPLVPYEGGQILSNRGEVKSTDESMLYWINRNQTDTTPVKESYDDLDPEDNSTVEKYIYENGLNNSEVVLYKIVGGGHTEPSISEKYSQLYLNAVGNQNRDIEMAKEIWSFFEDKSK